MYPLISVIVPIYNVEKYLNRCIDSILNQTYKNLEIILVDDGSTDNSINIIKSYNDDRIKIYSKKNGGLSDARNYGLDKANGNYVSFIDSDDFIELDMFEKMVQHLTDRDIDIVVCDMKYLYDDGSTSFASGGNFVCGNVLENPDLILMNNSACNKLYKIEMFNDIKFPKGKYYEDLATIPILLYKAKKIIKIDEPFYIYFQRKGSIAHSANKKIFEIYDAIKSCIDYVKSTGNEEIILKKLYSMYIVHGLDITTIRIKDFDNKNIRKEYLLQNMELLKNNYPDYMNDIVYKNYGLKKKIIFQLLRMGLESLVLKIYDK